MAGLYYTVLQSLCLKGIQFLPVFKASFSLFKKRNSLTCSRLKNQPTFRDPSTVFRKMRFEEQAQKFHTILMMIWIYSNTRHSIFYPHPLPPPSCGRHNLIIPRMTLSESDISTTRKGFAISILTTRACRKLRLLGLLQGL